MSLHGTDVRPNVEECRALAVTAKGKKLVKPKIVGRRSTEESAFLDDLIDFMLRSGSTGKDELFSVRVGESTCVKLRSRDIREALKDTCEKNGLDRNYFSSHSLRKGAITEMRSLGASEDDRRDRGNYAPNSQVMNITYDYGAGIGPLASNSLVGGHKPTIEDLRRLIPPARAVEKGRSGRTDKSGPGQSLGTDVGEGNSDPRSAPSTLA